jgi:exosortase
VENVATSAPRSAAAKISRRWSSGHWLLGAGIFFLWFILCRQLSSEWSVNEQYNYGWFVPFFAAYLFWLRWEERPRPQSGNGKVESRKLLRGSAKGLAVIALLVLFPLRLFEVANPDWRPVSWVHAGIVAALSLILIWRTGGKPWLTHFAFPIAFFFVAVPWVTPIEAPIVQGLMHGIAAIDSEVLNLFGIPAQLEGSLIRVSTGLVGVDEACSGVRSLQTSLMIALLFGELNRLTPWRWLALVGGALLLALIANTIRAFLLVWLAATRGISTMEKGHDLAGYGILAIVFVGSLGLARWLAPRRKIENGTEPAVASESNSEVAKQAAAIRFPLATPGLIFCLGWLIAVEVAVESWYRLHERNLVRTAQWTVAWPEGEPAFRKIKIDDQVRMTLRYDQGGGATWQARPASPPASAASPDNIPLNSLLYFFRWNPGYSSVLRARAHRPDLCLPNTGWKQTADDGVRAYPTDAGLALPFRHFEFAQPNESKPRSAFAHAFFCIWQDQISARSGSQGAGEGVAGAAGDWITIADKIRAVREGQRELGQQVIELVLTSAQKISAAEAEQVFSDQIKGTVKLAPPAL